MTTSDLSPGSPSRAGDLDALKSLLAAATPLPWESLTTPMGRVEISSVTKPGVSEDDDSWHKVGELRCCHLHPSARDADAALIVAAVNGLPALLAELEQLRGEVDQMLRLAQSEAVDARAKMAAVADESNRNLTALSEAAEELAEARAQVEALTAERDQARNLARANEEAHRSEVRQILAYFGGQGGILDLDGQLCAKHGCARWMCECPPSVAGGAQTPAGEAATS